MARYCFLLQVRPELLEEVFNLEDQLARLE